MNPALATAALYDPASMDGGVINIHVKCSDLDREDGGSRSGPIVVMSALRQGEYVEVASTEVVANSADPEFVTVLKALYVFEMDQPLLFDVREVNPHQDDSVQRKLLGQCYTKVQSLVVSVGRSLSCDLALPGHPKDKGKITFTVDHPCPSADFWIRAKISASEMKKMRCFSKNCPFFVVEQVTSRGAFVPVYKSEVKPKSQQCTWKGFELPLQNLSPSTNVDVPIAVALMDEQRHGNELIGRARGTINYFVETCGTNQEIRNEKGKKTGLMKFQVFSVERRWSFLEYVQAGLNLNLITAMSFANANVIQTKPTSLHYISQIPNPYEQCMHSVGSILCPYSRSQNFAVYGFGAVIPGSNPRQMNQCFPLNGNEANPYVQGLDGILALYRSAVPLIEFGYPAKLAPVMKAAVAGAKRAWNESKTYSVLMILSDGMIDDLSDALDVIRNASSVAMSFIVIGIGDQPFTDLKNLGSSKWMGVFDDSWGYRDSCHFLAFRDYAHDVPRLAANLLSALPKQVEHFCRMWRFDPRTGSCG
jgi:hypothetical protein